MQTNNSCPSCGKPFLSTDPCEVRNQANRDCLLKTTTTTTTTTTSSSSKPPITFEKVQTVDSKSTPATTTTTILSLVSTFSTLSLTTNVVINQTVS